MRDVAHDLLIPLENNAQRVRFGDSNYVIVACALMILIVVILSENVLMTFEYSYHILSERVLFQES